MSETDSLSGEAILSSVQGAISRLEGFARNMGEVNQETMKAFAAILVTSVGAVVAQLQHLNKIGYFAEELDDEDSGTDCSGEDGDFESNNDDAPDEDIEDDTEGYSDISSSDGSVSDRLLPVTATPTAQSRKRALLTTDSAGGAIEEPAPTGELHDTRATTKRRRLDNPWKSLNFSPNRNDSSNVVAAGDAIKGWLGKLQTDVDATGVNNVRGGSRRNQRREAHDNAHEEAEGRRD